MGEIVNLGKIAVWQATNKSSNKKRRKKDQKIAVRELFAVIVTVWLCETTNIAQYYVRLVRRQLPGALKFNRFAQTHATIDVCVFVCVYQPSYNIIKIHFVVYQDTIFYLFHHIRRVRCIKFVHMLGKCEFARRSVSEYVS